MRMLFAFSHIRYYLLYLNIILHVLGFNTCACSDTWKLFCAIQCIMKYDIEMLI